MIHADRLYDDLRRVLPRVEGFKITAQTKRELVQGLMVAVEQRRVAWPVATRQGGVRREEFGLGGTPGGNWEVLTAEMRRYEYEIGPTGQVSYAAPNCYHDDCVMALALAVWGCHTYGVEPGMMLRLGEGLRSGDRGRRTVTLA